MKKSVILVIAVIYIASIFIVGLLGIKMGLYNVTVYTEEIIYVPAGVLNVAKSDEIKKVYKKDGANGYYIENVYSKDSGYDFDVYIDEPFVKGKTFELKFQVRPDNVTKRGLEYAYDKSDKTIYKVDEETGEQIGNGFVTVTVNSDGNAVITFYDEGTFNITVKPADGANVKLTVRINVEIY